LAETQRAGGFYGGPGRDNKWGPLISASIVVRIVFRKGGQKKAWAGTLTDCWGCAAIGVKVETLGREGGELVASVYKSTDSLT